MKPILFVACLLSLCNISQGQVVLKDIFGRDLAGHTITLVDWEGYMANPAIKLTITPPSAPLTVTLTANHARLYFDMPSTGGIRAVKDYIIYKHQSPEFLCVYFPGQGSGR